MYMNICIDFSSLSTICCWDFGAVLECAILFFNLFNQFVLSTVEVLLFVEFQFSWISCFTKCTKYNIQRNTKYYMVTILLQVWKQELGNQWTNKASSNHEYWRPRI